MMHPRGSFHLVLVADGSEGTDAAARAVRDLIDPAAIGRITVVAVGNPYDFVDDWVIGVLGLVGIVSQPMVDGLWKQAESWAVAETDRVEKLLGCVSVPVVSVIRSGNPVDEVLAIVRSDGTDLVVIGSDCGRKHHRKVRQDVAGELTRRAPCPVLVVRADSEKPPITGKRVYRPGHRLVQPATVPALAGLGAT
jgi:nucleotide-binding universal stress UspA family protein